MTGKTGIDREKTEASAAVNAALRALLESGDGVGIHGYTPAAGLPSLRHAIAQGLHARYGAPVTEAGVYVCCGASAGLAACCRGLLCPGEEAAASEALGEYVRGAGGVLRAFESGNLAAALSDKTALVLAKTLAAEDLESLAAAQRRSGRPIYLVTADPESWKACDNSVLCASFSEALDIPGERLGYLAVNARMEDGAAVFAALAGAARAAGYVNPPSLMQRAVERCL